jgi:TrpR-related protein YerC/YecD
MATLTEALLTLKTPEESLRFLKDLCTPAEIKELQERWSIAQLLDKGQYSYREIAKMLAVSVTTVGRVARFLKDEPYQGYAMVLKRLKK